MSENEILSQDKKAPPTRRMTSRNPVSLAVAIGLYKSGHNIKKLKQAK